MELRLWLLNKGPFQKAFFQVLQIYENEKIMNEKSEVSVDLLIFMVSAEVLKRRAELQH